MFLLGMQRRSLVTSQSEAQTAGISLHLCGTPEALVFPLKLLLRTQLPLAFATCTGHLLSTEQ